MQKLVEVGHTGTHEYVQQFCVKQLLGSVCFIVALSYLFLCHRGKGKVKLFLCLNEHHAMKTYWENGGKALCTLNLDSRWKQVFLSYGYKFLVQKFSIPFSVKLEKYSITYKILQQVYRERRMNIKQILVWIKQRRHNRLQKIQTSSNFKN
jgi:hypothetical protein